MSGDSLRVWRNVEGCKFCRLSRNSRQVLRMVQRQPLGVEDYVAPPISCLPRFSLYLDRSRGSMRIAAMTHDLHARCLGLGMQESSL